MINFRSLFSGSSGNCLLIETDKTKLLVDAGVSCKKIELSLSTLNIMPSDIDAILITHEHIDHVQGLGTFSKKFNTPVYANLETFEAMPIQKNKILEENQKLFELYNDFFIGDLKIHSFGIPHDAANPCGFNIWKGNKKITIATDIGHMNNDLLKYFENSLFVMLEANYDPEVLKCSSYPFSLKTRISGPTGHLTNEMAGKTISHLLNHGLKSAMIGHLSKENNFPELAYKTVVEELMSNNFTECSLALTVAHRDISSKLITI